MTARMLDAVLVANRGEIALRVISTLRELGIRAVAAYSDADADAPFVRAADEAVRLGPAAPGESYLHAERVIAAAQAAGVTGVHPGYGFLSESAAFARACRDAGLVFVGPPPEAMEALGDKVAAKRLAREAGVPVLPGLDRPGLTDAEIEAFAAESPDAFPLIVKAAAGGGGRGMRVVRSPGELGDALASARREARAGFGDDALLVERFVARARHVEVQVLADRHGAVVHLGERECSLQRRHQKVIEESPSPIVSAAGRERLGAAAVELFRAAGYEGAGTAEFLVPADATDEFYFLEVNARLQVEHPVTEAVTGLDLVALQLRIAAGEPLGLTQEEIVLRGHAVEARVCAEDPTARFLPTAGFVRGYRAPAGVRTDSGVAAGSIVGTDYDSLLAKVIAHADDRRAALARCAQGLSELRLLGVATNAGFLRRLLTAESVVRGELDTGLIERGEVPLAPGPDEVAEAAVALAVMLRAELGARRSDPWETCVGFRIEGEAPVEFRLHPEGADQPLVIGVAADAATVAGRAIPASLVRREGGRVWVSLGGRTRPWDHACAGERHWLAAGADAFCFTAIEPARLHAEDGTEGALEVPMPGLVLSVAAREGATVAKGETLVVIESMKMELSITAPAEATVGAVLVREGQSVRQGQAVVELVHSERNGNSG